MSRLIFGTRPIGEFLRTGARDLQAVWISDRRAKKKEEATVAQLRALAAERRLPVITATDEQLRALCGEHTHQGLAAVIGDFDYCDLEQLFEPPVERPPLILVVDGVTDPQNLGAMLRSAAVFGASGVVLTKDRCSKITPTVVRVSSGATEHLPCALVTNLARALRQIKEAGIWVVGTVESGGSSPHAAPLTEPVAVVMGSEQKGLRHNVQRVCDTLVTIPGGHMMAALNVAAATAVMMYEAARQRVA